MNIIYTFFANQLFILITIYILIWGSLNRPQIALKSITAGVIALILSTLLKLLINDPRPYLQSQSMALVPHPPVDGSFPSTHTAVIMAYAIVMMRQFPQQRWFWIGMVLVIGASRVLVRVHYPVDIVGGTIIGIIAGFLAEKYFFRLLNLLN